MFLYRTQSSANRRTKDLILTGKHLERLKRESVLRPTPGVHRIKQGLDLRLGHLRLLVDCAQRARNLSI